MSIELERLIKTKKMKTDKEVKAECIKQLELLIEDIKNDQTGNCYSYNAEILERQEMDDCVISFVRYGIQRNEYYFKKE